MWSVIREGTGELTWWWWWRWREESIQQKGEVQTFWFQKEPLPSNLPIRKILRRVLVLLTVMI